MTEKTVTFRGGPRDGEVRAIASTANIVSFPIMPAAARADDKPQTADYRPHPANEAEYVFVGISPTR